METDSSSFRFTQGSSQLLHIALFIRDTAALPVPDAPDNPPMLLRRPTPSVVVPADRVSAAVEQWRQWWRELVRHDSLSRVPGSPAHHTPIGEVLRRAEHAFDPPDFHSMTGEPDLRLLVSNTYLAAVEWANRYRREQSGPDPRPEPALDLSLIRAAARSVAHEGNVGLGRLDATVQVLDVNGTWSAAGGPGTWLCSRAAARDPHTAAVVIRNAFLSALAR